MFQHFSNLWTPIGFTRDVTPNKPASFTIAGEPVTAFRGANGEAGVMFDRCPHRGARLSCGTVTEAGHLKCPYHGWQFKTSGEIAVLPLNPLPQDPKRLSATSFPVREHAGLVWMFTATSGSS